MVAVQTGRAGRVRFNSTFVVATLLLFVVTALIAALAVYSVIDEDDSGARTVVPQASSADGAGEGLRSDSAALGTTPNVAQRPTDRGVAASDASAATTLPKAHYVPAAGEGIGAGYSREALAPTRSIDDTLFMEQNTQLPSGTVATPRLTTDEILFREQNIDLMNLAVPVEPVAPPMMVDTMQRIRFLEANQLPGDDIDLVPPAPRFGATEY